MSIGRLRWRVVLALGAAAAAVAALAIPAGASTGARWTSPEMAGYTATGAQFGLITARIYLRNPAQYAGEVASLGHSVQLWSSSSVAIAGLRANTSGSGYTPYATIYNRSTHAVIASDPRALWCTSDSECDTTVGSWPYGQTLKMFLLYEPSMGLLILEVFPPGGDKLPSFQAAYTIGSSESYTQARVGTEFGSTPWDASYSHSPPAQSVKAATYSEVQLTSYSGHTATLSSWWVHHKLLASTGQQLVATPRNLYDGGASFTTWLTR